METGKILLSKAGVHTVISGVIDDNGTKSGRIVHTNAPPMHGVRPAVDKTFESAAHVYGKRCVSVILSGMGNDAGEGARVIKEAGGVSLVCDEKDCLVYGMARSAIQNKCCGQDPAAEQTGKGDRTRSITDGGMMASEFEAYRGLFVAESRENHENLVKNLLILEKGPDQNAIDEIFRSVHTLKGASASMGFAEMERLCHAMEDVFQLVRSGSAEVSEELENLLLACSDVLEQMIDDVEGGGDSSSLNAEDKVSALKDWLGQKGKKTPAPDKAPPAKPARRSRQLPQSEERASIGDRAGIRYGHHRCS